MKENKLKLIGRVLKLENEEFKEERKLRHLNRFIDGLTKK